MLVKLSSQNQGGTQGGNTSQGGDEPFDGGN